MPSLLCVSFLSRMSSMHKHAFTMIELLVVIGIIALLATLLIPTIAMVRDAAYTTACASNQRQIVMGAMQWGTDHKGYLVPGIWYETLPTDHQHYDSTLASVGVSGRASACPAPPGGSIGLNQTTVWGGAGPGTPGDGFWWWGEADKYFWIRGNTTLNAVRSPAEKIYFGDSEYYVLAYWDNSVTIGRRHKGRANLAWMDGHVSKEPQDYLSVYRAGGYFNSP